MIFKCLNVMSQLVYARYAVTPFRSGKLSRDNNNRHCAFPGRYGGNGEVYFLLEIGSLLKHLISNKIRKNAHLSLPSPCL